MLNSAGTSELQESSHSVPNGRASFFKFKDLKLSRHWLGERRHFISTMPHRRLKLYYVIRDEMLCMLSKSWYLIMNMAEKLELGGLYRHTDTASTLRNQSAASRRNLYMLRSAQEVRATMSGCRQELGKRDIPHHPTLFMFIKQLHRSLVLLCWALIPLRAQRVWH